MHIDFYVITKLSEDPNSYRSEELLSDIVKILAKHKIVSERILLDFLESVDCEQKDILHLALIEAGKSIEKDSLLED
ncbi:hypothetical protein [Niallia sp.]|uniref:hypothetical protein n=1 Tax=Niallia sp. TaxID=2837523 RepID=UPI00289902DD|nr:hypothetical protein [Niallia sp.]